MDMPNIVKNIYKYKAELSLFFLALLIQSIVLILLIFENKTGYFFQADSRDYLTMAENIFFKHEFSITTFGGPDALRLPLYSLMISLLYYALIPKIWFVIIIQNLIAAMSVVFVFKIAKIVFCQFTKTIPVKNKLSAIASLMFLFESERIQMANTIMCETLFVFLLLLSFFYFFKWIFESKSYKNIMLSSCFLGLATLTKPASQALPIIFIFFIILYFIIDGRKNLQKYALSAVLFSVVFVSILSPWSIRNKYQFGTFKISPLSGDNLWELRVLEWIYDREIKAGAEPRQALEKINAILFDSAEKIRIKYFPQISESVYSERDSNFQKYFLYSVPADNFLLKESYKKISEHPISFAIFTSKGIARFFITSSAAYIIKKITSPIVSIPGPVFFPYLFWIMRAVWIFYSIIIFAGLFLYQKIEKHNFWLLGFLAVVILYFAALGSMGHITRFRLPADPFIFILFLCSFYLIINRKSCAVAASDRQNQ